MKELEELTKEELVDLTCGDDTERVEPARAELATLRAQAEQLGPLVEALENSLGWMKRWNETIDETPSEVARDMYQSQQTLTRARAAMGPELRDGS